ncbi:MAG: TolC family protein, partial [Chthoniobacteraceae bacterium]
EEGNAGSIQNKSWRVAIEARQVLYSGGQIRAALNIAKLTQDSSYYQLRDVVDQVISVVRQQFYTVLLNRALILVAEEAVRLQEEELRDQRNRFEAGTVPRFNVLRAEVELANVQPNLIRARNEYLIAQLELAKILGLDPGPGGRPTFNVVGNLAVTERALALDDALILAKARRPFLKVQRQSVLIETEQITVEMAGYKPRVDANAGYEIRNKSSSSDLSDTVNGWFFGFTGSWDIFDGFATYGRVKQARARLEQSRINYYDSVRQVELEVQTAYADLRQAQETISSQQKNVEQALEALRLAQERLAAGAGTQLEVLDARVALTRARTTELQARADYSRAVAEFDRATATDTVYNDTWRDPLFKAEKGVFARLAETGLPKPPEDLDENGGKTVKPARAVPNGRKSR